jgi:general secretion pathway protein D
MSPAWLAALLALGLTVQPALGQDDPPPDDDEEADQDDEPVRPMPLLPGPAGPLRRGMPGPSRKPVGGPGVQAGPEGPDAPPPPPPPGAGDAGGDEGGDGGDAGGSTTHGRNGGDQGDEADEREEATVTPSGERQRPPPLDPNAKVSIDFVDTDINDLIRYMAEITGRNFILGEKLSGTITIISHQQVTRAEAYEAFLSALEVAGFTTVTVGKATKVVKSSDSAKVPLRTYHDGDLPYTDNYVTQIMQLENVDVKEISSVIKELASGQAHVIAYSPTNTLIITETATNLRRIYSIVKELDVASPKSTVQIMPLRYATAADVETIIEELYGVEGSSSSSSGDDAARSAAARRRADRAARRRGDDPEQASEASSTSVGEGRYISKIISDERTNSLIIQANEEAMSSIRDLVARLDVDVDPSSRSQIHVVYLEHANAEDVAQVLSNLANASSSGSSRSSSSRGGRQTDARGRPMPPGGRDAGAAEEGEDKSAGAAAAFESGLKVASDENTNSLVIIAGPEEFRVIKQVIDKLDIRRKQVFVEVVILEMASEDTFDMGIGYHTGVPREDGGYGIYSAQLNGSSLGLTTDALSGLAMGVFGQSMALTVGEGTETMELAVPVFGIALNALQANSRVNIISTPNVLTMDNEEAEFVVGRNIPFPVSTGRDSNNNPIVSYQREDVATTLKVTPQINESNYVTLEVYQEVQEVEEDSKGLDVSTAGFITSKRSADTTVVVKDNQTVVLGGLIGNTDTEVESKIPLLGDLPLVGALFRGRRTVSRKTNLLIFLTPHVIDGPEDLEEVYRVKVAQRDEFIRRFYGKSQQEQEAELARLLQYSMNLVDRPSAYRTKLETGAHTSTITGSSSDQELSQDAQAPVDAPDTAPAPAPDATPAPAPDAAPVPALEDPQEPGIDDGQEL